MGMSYMLHIFIYHTYMFENRILCNVKFVIHLDIICENWKQICLGFVYLNNC